MTKTDLLLDVVVFIAVVAFVEGLFTLLHEMRHGPDKPINRRLQAIAAHGNDHGAALASLLRKPMAEGLPWLKSLLRGTLLLRLERLIATSGLRISTQRVVLYIGILTLVLFLTFNALSHRNLASLFAAAALGIAIPLVIIMRVRNKRAARVTAQLPDALDMMVRSMRAGHPVPAGIGLVAREMQDPLGTEFGIVHDEMAYGLDLRQALEKMRDRLGLSEINYMVVAIRIQYATGGSLAEVLASLASIIRERGKLRAKAKAMSAEARLSGKILGALPILVVLGINLLNPTFYSAVPESTGLQIALGTAASMVLLGWFLLRKFTNFTV